MKLDEYCSSLDLRLAACPPGGERLKLAAEAVRQAFRVRADEVAIFSLDETQEVLRFLWPERLQPSGLLPLTSRDSLAARTAREKRSFVNNRFADSRHAAIFEQVRLEPQEKERPRPIQKIMSVPLLHEERVRGVVQVSRKGADAAGAGADFTQTELAALAEIARIIARHL
jgi:hypothetical protein